ncbi:SGNH/GDSL hydrolase family protein [bacterium]|nr:SGNH/GDSL hydrolase family protein [bacterium]
MLEVFLRFSASYLSSELCNELTRSYTIERGGIYFIDLDYSRTQFMRPNSKDQVVFNGYRWLNETDERGLRNPPGAAHEIMVLGDSFLYGHGVNESDTAIARLRQKYQWKVYNAARQGDCLSQEYTIFRLYFDELKPKHLILTCCGNDLLDLERRTPAEQADPPELKPDYVTNVRYNMQDPNRMRPVGNLLTTSYSYRLFRWLGYRLQGRRPDPPALEESLRQTQRQREQHYFELLFSDMLARCQSAGCSLQVVFVTVAPVPNGWRAEQSAVKEFLKELCAANHVPFYDTEPMAQDHPEYSLPGDGHLSPAGNAALADFMARELPEHW